MADVEQLLLRFRRSGHDQQNRSPFYCGLHRHIADAPHVAAILQAAPERQQLPVLLLAAVHSLVLADLDLELAQWYPTATDRPLTTDPFPAFERLCMAREDDLRAIVANRVTQTNEVGRSALLLPVLGLVERECGPVSLVDVGTSAGLNLQLDRFAYRYEPGGEVGDESPVTLRTVTRGTVPVPSHVPTIAARIGLDRHPIDVDDPIEARWLMACVWPDQAERFERLRSAIELARRHRAALVAGDAVDAVGPIVTAAALAGHPVVTNSWVLNYLTDERRRTYVATLDGLGDRLDLSWIFAEQPDLTPGLPYADHVHDEHRTVLSLVRWRDGVRSTHHLGIAHPHGYWLHWEDDDHDPEGPVIPVRRHRSVT